MAKKVGNTFIPKFISDNVPWYDRDGLNIWYEQNKCNEFLENTDHHFENLQIINFDLIFNEDKLSDQKIKQYQEIDHKEIMKYPEREREQIMSSIFRDSRRQGMFIQKETVHKHFKVNSKSIGQGRFVQKLKNDHYKETW